MMLSKKTLSGGDVFDHRIRAAKMAKKNVKKIVRLFTARRWKRRLILRLKEVECLYLGLN